MKREISFWSQVRYKFAFIVLAIMTLVMPFVTIYYNSAQTNNIVALGQFFFFLILFRESVLTLFKFLTARKNLVVSIFLVAIIFALVFSYFESGSYNRTFFYFSGIAFFFSLVFLFRGSEFSVFGFLFFKIFSVFLVFLVFVFGLFLNGDIFYEDLTGNPPVYRNIRHFNYDLMVSLGCVFFICLWHNFRFYLLFF